MNDDVFRREGEAEVFVSLYRVVSLAMSPQDDTFLSGSTDDTIRLWDLRAATAQVNRRSSVSAHHAQTDSEFLTLFAGSPECCWTSFSRLRSIRISLRCLPQSPLHDPHVRPPEFRQTTFLDRSHRRSNLTRTNFPTSNTDIHEYQL